MWSGRDTCTGPILELAALYDGDKEGAQRELLPRRFARVMRTQGAARVRGGAREVGFDRSMHRPSPRRCRGMDPGL